MGICPGASSLGYSTPKPFVYWDHGGVGGYPKKTLPSKALVVLENRMPKNPTNRVPLLAIVGRPNVGKSTLFNRLIGSRRAIVGDEPGITRDRLYGETTWEGRRLRVVDTGGIIPDDKEFIPAEIFRQAKVAFEEASIIAMVVDARTELASTDME